MLRKLLLSTLLFSGAFTLLFAQNYLRVINPNSWWGEPISSEPGWEMYQPHGTFTDVTIVAAPKGIYTEIEVFATILQVENTWGEFAEVIWQFDLPAQTIVHDSWLWVEEDIIKADMVDFWTALATYEEIVDRQQDPSFFYILPDNRYEIRIYPIEEGDTRRVKLSFLVPANWSAEKVTTDLLVNLFQSTDYPIGEVNIAMPVNTQWGTPTLKLDEQLITMSETVIGGTGETLHYITLDGDDFVAAEEVSMILDAPFASSDKTYVNTYEQDGEQYYQLAYAPQWESTYQDPSPEKALLLIDYKASKTDLSIEDVSQLLQAHLSAHFSSQDEYNIALATTDGVVFLNPNEWMNPSEDINQAIANFISLQNTSNLQLLLQEGLAWANTIGNATHVYLFAANDDYFYPPLADEIFDSLDPAHFDDLVFELIDYQTENVSIIYYQDEEYQGNTYFYQLLIGGFTDAELTTIHGQNTSLDDELAALFPPIQLANGTVDFNVSLDNGLCYERFTLSSSEMNANNQGVFLQTGKYLGTFPMQIEGFLVTEDNFFTTINTGVPAEEVSVGDTLMQEMWYSHHLSRLFGQVASNEDRENIIDLSITERILTPLTAFLALEPEQGGEPCIDCLLNNGEIILINTDEEFDLTNAQISINPNPVVDQALITLEYPSGLATKDWQATIYNAAGAAVQLLDAPGISTAQLEWKWDIASNTPAGIYYCRISSPYGERTVKIVVMK